MTVFHSKRDRWLSAIVVGTGLLLVGALVPLLLRVADPRSWIGIALTVSTLGLLAWVFLGTRYVLDGETLSIRSGPFRWKVCARDIVEISPTDDPSSSPALSLDRLSIKYRRGGEVREILVSPDDQQAFMEALMCSTQPVRSDRAGAGTGERGRD